MDSYSIFHQSRLNMPKSEIVCKPQGFSLNLKAHRKVGFFVVCRKIKVSLWTKKNSNKLKKTVGGLETRLAQCCI